MPTGPSGGQFSPHLEADRGEGIACCPVLETERRKHWKAGPWGIRAHTSKGLASQGCPTKANGAGAKAEPAEGQEVREGHLGALAWGGIQAAGSGRMSRGWRVAPSRGECCCWAEGPRGLWELKILALFFVALSSLTCLCLPSSLGITTCGCLEDQQCKLMQIES